MSCTDEESRRPQAVVVGVDGSASSKAALVWAAGQAKRTGAPLQAVITWELPPNYGWPGPKPDLDPAADAKALLEGTLREVLGPDPDIEPTVTVIEGHPAQVLEGLSKTASVVVVGTRGHRRLAGMILGSVSEHVTAHAHCPVVVVRNGHQATKAS